MLLQGVCFKAMGHCVKVVIAYPTDKAFGLKKNPENIHVVETLYNSASFFGKIPNKYTTIYLEILKHEV